MFVGIQIDSLKNKNKNKNDQWILFFFTFLFCEQIFQKIGFQLSIRPKIEPITYWEFQVDGKTENSSTNFGSVQSDY